MAYSEEDMGFIGVFIVVMWVGLMYYILTTLGLTELQAVAVEVPLVIGAFLFWVRRENAKIRKQEEEEAAAAAKKAAAKGGAPAEPKKDK